MSNPASKQVLIVDSLFSMRDYLQKAFQHFGFVTPHAVADIQDALRHLKSTSYNLIICDYDLGDGTNGQQFLEYLRTSDLISRNTIFIMSTAERGYEKIVAVAECAPDSYLLKPYALEQLQTRVDKLLERQECFREVDRAADLKNWSLVVDECDFLLDHNKPYLVETCRIKGAALLRAMRPQEAMVLYKKVIELQPAPWARLGLARAMSMMGDKQGGITIARNVLEDHEHYMEAYDFLGKELAETGDKNGALEALQSASRISPGTLNRTRHLADLAFATGRLEIAEHVLSEALEKHRHSPVVQARDYAMLSAVLIEEGCPDRALEVIAGGKARFVDDTSRIELATSECQAYRHAGQRDLAEKTLAELLAADLNLLPSGVATAVAKACFALGKTERGNEILKQVVQNYPGDLAVQVEVRDILAATGVSDQAAAEQVAASIEEVVRINNQGVRKAETGELEEAVNMLCDAADRLPNNLQIVSNAALALAMDMRRHGYTSIKMHACLGYREKVFAKAPSYPKLADIDAVLDHIKRP